MPNTLETTVTLADNGLQLEAAAGGNPPIVTGYGLPGEIRGYSPMEVLLISLATCAGATVVALLRKFRKDVSAFSVSARGEQREEHPKSFARIELAFSVVSADATEDTVRAAIAKTEEKYCPVWAMIKGSAAVTSTAAVTRPQ